MPHGKTNVRRVQTLFLSRNGDDVSIFDCIAKGIGIVDFLFWNISKLLTLKFYFAFLYFGYP